MDDERWQVTGSALDPGMLAVASTLAAGEARSPGSRPVPTTCRSPTSASRSSPASSASSTSPTAPPPWPRWRECWPRAAAWRPWCGARSTTAQGTGSPLAAPIAAADPAARAALLADAETTLAQWQGADEFAFPIGALLLSGRAP
jgi:hypothetical protein